MGVEVKPLGIKCNIACQYCYQNPERDAGNYLKNYDIGLIKNAIEKEGKNFTLFGGEPLLLPEKDLEELWNFGFKNYGLNTLQTNGSLINERHIKMFKDYKVSVGISIDGPGKLNDIRWAGNTNKTREITQKTEKNIKKIISEGIFTILIVTIHKLNSNNESLPILLDWFRYLDKIGVRFVRIHLLEGENSIIKQKYSLTAQENIKVLLELSELEKDLKQLRFDIFKDIEELLTAQDSNVGCVWGACDPYTTPSVIGIDGLGQKTNCERANKEGINFLKSDSFGYERYLALYNTPQEYGGCKGCRFFLMCKGYCPGTAIDNDWRNRTEYCEVWKKLFEIAEQNILQKGKTPLSLAKQLKNFEQKMLEIWETGSNPNLFKIFSERKSSE